MTGLDFDTRRLARWAIFALRTTVLAEIAFIALSIMSLQYYTALQNGTEPPAYLGIDEGRLDIFTAVIASGYAAVYFGTIIICAFWVYRSARNAQNIMPTDDRISPGMCVAWYIVPIMNLWKPYQGMKHIWNSRAGAEGVLDSPLPTNAKLWWGAWVITTLLGNFSLRLSGQSDLGSLITLETVNLTAGPFSIAAAILFAGLIREITDMQEQNAGVAAVFE